MQEENLRKIMERNHRLAFGWALQCCNGNRDEAADILQSVYVQILDKGANSFRGDSSFKTWLFSIIRNNANRRRIKLSRRLKKIQDLILAPSNPETDSESRYIANEFRSQVLDLLGRLSEKQRLVLHLVFYQGLTLQEAAEVMGISVGSVRTHYERGKTKLREEMKKIGWNNE